MPPRSKIDITLNLLRLLVQEEPIVTMPSLNVRQTTASAGPVYYPPSLTNINNLTFVINGTGTNGIYNSSHVSNSHYGVYNWCNMPHVRSTEYVTPSFEYKLQYVEVIHRHHKRTPYGSNTFFKEDVTWNGDNEGPYHYGRGAGTASKVSPISWQGMVNNYNPLANSFGQGFIGSTLQFPQITQEGLVDSHQHGKDLASVYGGILGFLPLAYDSKLISFRVTNNVITSQVLGALLAGIYPLAEHRSYQALVQPSTYDSLEPTYSCPAASSIYNSYTGNNPAYQSHLIAAQSLYKKLDSVSGISPTDTAGWHSSFDHYFDNLSAKLCHQKKLPCSLNDTSICITQAEANEVFRLGNYEYSYFWRDAPASINYSRLHFGAWFVELRAHLEGSMNGSDPMLYRHNVAHDGSIAPLLSILQISEMVWPGMGSEVVFELYKKIDKFFLRVLWGGQVMKTSTPLGTLDMIPIQDFLDYLSVYIPEDLRAACNV